MSVKTSQVRPTRNSTQPQFLDLQIGALGWIAVGFALAILLTQVLMEQ